MALQNPAGLYRGGVVDLNPMPYVNIAIQARQRRDAREEAIDKYYRDLPGKINDAGVRDQERPLIEDYRNKIMEYGIMNKDALKRGDGAAQLGMERLFREANNVVARSKDLGKRQLERGKMYLNKENRWVVDDDDFMAAEELESLPINDPRHQQMDMPALLSNRPFDEKEFGTEVKGKIKYGTKAVRQTDPTNPLYDIVSEVPNIDKQTAEQIYSFAAEKVNGNKRFENFIKNKTPEQLAELNTISQRVFGHPIRPDFAEEDAAAAYTVLQIPVTSTKQKSQQDIEAVMDRKWKEKLDWGAIAQQYKEKNIRLNKAGGGTYEIDNVPKVLEEKKSQVQIINPSTGKMEYVDVVDITDLPSSYKDDIFTPKKNKWGQYENKPIINQGRQYLKVNPDGSYEGAGGYKVTPKDVIINTHKRTVGEEKPAGTGKMKVRGSAPNKNTETQYELD